MYSSLLILLVVLTSAIAKDYPQIAYTEQDNNGLKFILVTKLKSGISAKVKNIGLISSEEFIEISENDAEALYKALKRLKLNKFPAKDSMEARNNYIISITPTVGKKKSKIYVIPHEKADEKILAWIATLKELVENSIRKKTSYDHTSYNISIQVLNGIKTSVKQDNQAKSAFKKCIFRTNMNYLASTIKNHIQNSYLSDELSEMNTFAGSQLGQRYLKAQLAEFNRQHNKAPEPIKYTKTELNNLNSFFESNIGKMYFKLLNSPYPDLTAIVNKKLGQLMQSCKTET